MGNGSDGRMAGPKDKHMQAMRAALSLIKPKGGGVLSEVKKTLNEINTALAREKLDADAVLGGSFAKGTYLSGDFDVDVFARFDPKKHGNDDLSGLLEKALSSFKPERIHGSRDYFQFRKGGVQYEVVPVLRIKRPEDARNVTDCSPLHVKWVEKNIGRLHDDIRLAKQFIKSAGAYGAESYIRGFSGHVVDLLVIMNGGFLKLLKAASAWKEPVVIDHLKAHKGRALARLNPAKTQSPLIIVDPVQPMRNASASLSKERFDAFRTAATAFLAEPSESYFKEKPIDLKKMAKKGRLIMATAEPTEGKQDVAGSKLLQADSAMAQALEEFGVVEKQWRWRPGEKAVFAYALKRDLLEATRRIEGPPSRLKDHARSFKKKHPNAKEEKGRMVSVEKRDIRTPAEALKKAIRSDYIKARVKKISICATPPA